MPSPNTASTPSPFFGGLSLSLAARDQRVARLPRLQQRGENGTPKVVLYQFDLSDPMNPHGLLIAYAEKAVKPVCSDFDTFTIGSMGMTYASMEAKPDQVELVNWSLDRTTELLETPATKGWMGRVRSRVRSRGRELGVARPCARARSSLCCVPSSS